jgi:NAD(P)-dependent dehydrogenase (short-subunit alcohol dehydrogenase family)
MDTPPVNELLDFMGKTAVITGSGSGIGVGIALRFAEAGANVVVNYHSSAVSAKEVIEKINKIGKDGFAFQADVTKRQDVEMLVQRTTKVFGSIDVLINNAGIYPVHPLLEMEDIHWDSVIDINLKSVFICTQLAANHMIANKISGSIVNIASIEAEYPAVGHSHYNAAKSGVLMYTRSSACELGEYGIRVNAISPGLIWRDGIEETWTDGVKRWKVSAPLSRLGYPEDVADACLFLASSAARWITGANLRVDGGVTTNPAF